MFGFVGVFLVLFFKESKSLRNKLRLLCQCCCFFVVEGFLFFWGGWGRLA